MSLWNFHRSFSDCESIFPHINTPSPSFDAEKPAIAESDSPKNFPHSKAVKISMLLERWPFSHAIAAVCACDRSCKQTSARVASFVVSFLMFFVQKLDQREMGDALRVLWQKGELSFEQIIERSLWKIPQSPSLDLQRDHALTTTPVIPSIKTLHLDNSSSESMITNAQSAAGTPVSDSRFSVSVKEISNNLNEERQSRFKQKIFKSFLGQKRILSFGERSRLSACSSVQLLETMHNPSTSHDQLSSSKLSDLISSPAQFQEAIKHKRTTSHSHRPSSSTPPSSPSRRHHQQTRPKEASLLMSSNQLAKHASTKTQKFPTKSSPISTSSTISKTTEDHKFPNGRLHRSVVSQHGLIYKASNEEYAITTFGLMLLVVLSSLTMGCFISILCTSCSLLIMCNLRLAMADDQKPLIKSLKGQKHYSQLQQNKIMIPSRKSHDISSNEYKKRVIMEGLLERSHTFQTVLKSFSQVDGSSGATTRSKK